MLKERFYFYFFSFLNHLSINNLHLTSDMYAFKEKRREKKKKEKRKKSSHSRDHFKECMCLYLHYWISKHVNFNFSQIITIKE
jgi:hypothetical protein